MSSLPALIGMWALGVLAGLALAIRTEAWVAHRRIARAAKDMDALARRLDQQARGLR